MMLHLILADAELESIPKSRDIDSEIPILDAYMHKSLLNTLSDRERRGRPDIVHQSLLLCQSSRLNRTDRLRTYVHTRDDIILQIDTSVKIPPNQIEFLKLMGHLFDGNDAKGYTVLRSPLCTLLDSLNIPVVVMSPAGECVGLPIVMDSYDNFAIIVGAFPCGDYRSPVYDIADANISLGPELFTVPTVISELLCAALR